uniref:Spore coat protein n=2 Tax=Cohnella candidum TaxID=2674991 RepID=A0A3G3JVN8_9BACL|nr:spore coat protein [Cohnella candidum]
MDETLRMAPHETMEVHEMVNFKTLCLAQSKLMQGIVFDRDLKHLMQKDVEVTMRHLDQLKGLYAKIRLQ